MVTPRQFPLTRELPLLQCAAGWHWLQDENLGRDFWVSNDSDGARWLVKMEGSFCAWRERAFSVIAQEVGISCHSTTFLLLEPKSPPVAGRRSASREQAATTYITEHVPGLCFDACPLGGLNAACQSDDPTAALLKADVRKIADLVRGEMLGFLCNQFEPPGYLYTPDHIFVQIDNSLMFCSEPADFFKCSWLRTKSGKWSTTGLTLARAMCEAVAALSDDVIEDAGATPPNFRITKPWSVQALIRNLRKRAGVILAQLQGLSDC